MYSMSSESRSGLNRHTGILCRMRKLLQFVLCALLATTCFADTPPTFNSVTSTTYTDQTTSDEVTASVSWTNGDIVVVAGATEDSTVTLGTPTTGGSGLTFSLVNNQGGASNTNVYIWKATASATSSGTITSAAAGGSKARGITAYDISGATSIGNSGNNQQLDGKSYTAYT